MASCDVHYCVDFCHSAGGSVLTASPYGSVTHWSLVMPYGIIKLGKLIEAERQNGQHFADDIFKYIFLNVNVWIPIEISLKLVPKGPINYIPALV